MMFERASKGGPARAKKKRAKAAKVVADVPLKDLLDRLFEPPDANRYNILLQTNGFEQVSDVKLASPAYFEALGMPKAAVELLMTEANRKEEEQVEEVSPVLILEVKDLVKEWFDKMDEDGSGEITMYEASDLLSSLGPREGSKLTWGELLAEIDTNRDGKISVDEVENIFLNAAPDNDTEFIKVVLTPLRDLRAQGWVVVDVRKKKAQAANPHWREADNNEGGVTDLRRIGENPGEDNHNKTMKLILSGLEAAAIAEANIKKKGAQRVISNRLAQPGHAKLFGMRRDDEDDEVTWVVNRKNLLDEVINEEEDDAISAARHALAAAGIKQVEVRALRKGWMDYDSETPARFIILDKWRKFAQWKQKCNGVILRMGIMRQYIQSATVFSAWKSVHTDAMLRKQREENRRAAEEAERQASLKGRVKGLFGKN
jgi:hypothetical protein